MVQVIDFNVKQKEGETHYVTLLLEGDIEMVQSQNTGRFYATVRTCTVSSTFDELTAARMVGKQMPGTIERVPCEPYDFTIQQTGEAVKLAYRWDYLPEGAKRLQQAKQTVPVKQEKNAQEIVLENDVTIE